MRIAVCDDDQAIREELIQLIQKQVSDVDIVRYQSGEEMISAKGNFDIYFLDIEMGSVSGMDLARRIREQEEGVRQLEQRMAQYGDVEPATEADVSGKLENLQKLMGQFTMPEDGEFSEEEMDKYV